MDAAHHIFVGTSAVEVSAPADRFESSAIQWVPLADVPRKAGHRHRPSNGGTAHAPGDVAQFACVASV